MPPESARSAADRGRPFPPGPLRGLALAAVAWLGAAASARADVVAASTGAQAICRPWTSEPCLTRVGASVQTERTGRPLAGRRLWFFAQGAPICSSVTDGSGVASCHGLAPSGRAIADAGYSVVFEGDGEYQTTVVHAR